MKKFKKVKLLFNNVKLIKECEELEGIIQKQKEIIEDQNQQLREYEIFTETDLLIARKNELEGLIDHYHVQKREFRKEINDLKQIIVELKREIHTLKTNKHNY